MVGFQITSNGRLHGYLKMFLCLLIDSVFLALFYANPCWNKPCHSYATCKVINRTEAICVCPKNCTTTRQPVCGTNWKTYDNLCSLMAESCAMNDWTSLRYNGECKLMILVLFVCCFVLFEFGYFTYDFKCGSSRII